MIEPYQFLLANAKEFGFCESNIGPASVDLRLGEVILLFPDQYPPSKEVKLFARKLNPYDEIYYFKPGSFYLCSTVEYIKVPETHCAFINMRSSFARKGLGHKMAGFIDPGFEGQVTLELTTDLPLSIQREERIVQIIFQRLSDVTEKPYKGKYLGQKGPTEAY